MSRIIRSRAAGERTTSCHRRHRLMVAASSALLLAVLLSLAGLLPGCTRSFVAAVGPNEDVSIFSDFPFGDDREQLVRSFLTRKRRAPVRPETRFDVDRGDSTVFRQRRDWRNLLILSDMSSARWGARLCADVLAPATHQRLVATDAGYAFAGGVWADGQTVLFLHARTPDALATLLAEEGEKLLAELENLVIDGIGATLFLSGEQRELTDGIRARHGYAIRIPEDFFVEEQAENRFIRLKKVPPDQAAMFLFVYYQEQSTAEVDPGLCMAIRDTLASVYFGGDRVERSRTESRPVRFLGRDAIEIYGLYQNDDPPMGGPFKMFCFHEAGRLYVIDLAVFNPPGSKIPQLRVLEAIARTFETAGLE